MCIKKNIFLYKNFSLIHKNMLSQILFCQKNVCYQKHVFTKTCLKRNMFWPNNMFNFFFNFFFKNQHFIINLFFIKKNMFSLKPTLLPKKCQRKCFHNENVFKIHFFSKILFFTIVCRGRSTVVCKCLFIPSEQQDNYIMIQGKHYTWIQSLHDMTT